MIRAIVVVCMLGLGVAHADPAREAIALLPLDTESKLEIYGQPVASEIARTLGDAPDLEVMVIGAKGTIPLRAKLVVSGKLTSKGGDAVQVTLYVRNPRDSKDPESIETTSSLEKIDRAAGELAGRLVPVLHRWLAGLRKTEPDTPPIRVDPRPPVTLQPTLVGITSRNSPELALLSGALNAQVPPWLAVHRREARTVDAASLSARNALQTVGGGAADRSVVFDVVEFTTRVDKRTRAVFAKARVRLRVSDAAGLLFDRVIVTDTIVGKPDVVPDKLLELTAREVLAIARPHMKRTVPGW